ELELALRLGRLDLAPHEALDRVDGIRRVRDRLTLGRLTDEALAARGEGHDRGRRAGALAVRDDPNLDLATARRRFDHRDAGVRRPEIDPDDLAHALVLLPRLWFRDHHHRRPQEAVPIHVPRLDLRDYRPRGMVARLDLLDGL